MRFAANGGLVKIRSLRVWDFAYREARKGNWETFVRDRDRFKRKIELFAPVLEKILEPSHREKVLERLRNYELTISSTQ